MSATAKDKFVVGDRVRMTEMALAQGLDGYIAKRRTGVVKGFPVSALAQNPELLLIVRRDGERSNRTYHMDFWERDEA